MDPKKIRRACAWCGQWLDRGGPLLDGEILSHGICPECEAAWGRDEETDRDDER